MTHGIHGARYYPTQWIDGFLVPARIIVWFRGDQRLRLSVQDAYTLLNKLPDLLEDHETATAHVVATIGEEN
ncbi:hypothetical protein [Nocardia macrotermitis]|uniref:hypothetical protein n=1 Tax=Nocardia macrotermitis TaxID=2585198 RepID=UPI0012961C04|nr:hypothetical protein [Nocardia macrotermitis]